MEIHYIKWVNSTNRKVELPSHITKNWLPLVCIPFTTILFHIKSWIYFLTILIIYTCEIKNSFTCTQIYFHFTCFPHVFIPFTTILFHIKPWIYFLTILIIYTCEIKNLSHALKYISISFFYYFDYVMLLFKGFIRKPFKL